MTDSNYNQLNQLVDQFQGQPFTILAFPCAQFFDQEPGNNDEILNCLKYVRPGNGFTPKFKLFQKADVNGASQHPVYAWMKTQCPAPSQLYGDLQYVSWNPLLVNDVTWNFGKTLISKEGKAYKRYNPPSDPLSLVNDIKYLLAH